MFLNHSSSCRCVPLPQRFQDPPPRISSRLLSSLPVSPPPTSSCLYVLRPSIHVSLPLSSPTSPVLPLAWVQEHPGDGQVRYSRRRTTESRASSLTQSQKVSAQVFPPLSTRVDHWYHGNRWQLFHPGPLSPLSQSLLSAFSIWKRRREEEGRRKEEGGREGTHGRNSNKSKSKSRVASASFSAASEVRDTVH